jgi:hypothetical protein
MPFKSEAQRRFLFALHPDIAQEFASKTPKGAKLPKKVGLAPPTRQKDEQIKASVAHIRSSLTDAYNPMGCISLQQIDLRYLPPGKQGLHALACIVTKHAALTSAPSSSRTGSGQFAKGQRTFTVSRDSLLKGKPAPLTKPTKKPKPLAPASGNIPDPTLPN